MIEALVSPLELSDAVSRFDDLLRSSSKEADFQRLFSECPYILSRTLPLRLKPSEIVPLGRPGKTEPDFVAFPAQGGPLSGYGIIELKRPDSRILLRPRKEVLILSRDARTAVAQSQVYGRQLRPSVNNNARLVMLGNRCYVFIIMGLSDELAVALSSQLYADQIAGLLPDNCQLIPYDTLLQSFRSTIPPLLLVLVPMEISFPRPKPPRRPVGDVCSQYKKMHVEQYQQELREWEQRQRRD